MAQVNIGAIKFNWKGPYNNSTAYVVDDVVSSGGSSYVCILASQGNAVSNGTYWQIMSSAGTNGTDGTDLSSTLSTRGDLVFKGASALTRLPKGTAGYYLKQGANDPEWSAVGAGASNAFLAEGMTGNASGTLVFNNEVFDDGGNYNISNGKYVCPSNGIYLFHFHALSSGSPTDILIRVNASNVGGMGTAWGYTRDGGDPDGVTVIYSLSQNDEVTCVTPSAAVYGNYCWFTGVKLY